MMLFSRFKNRVLYFFLMSLLLCGLVACGQVDHEPLVGEYGERLVNSFRLTESQIQGLNAAAVGKLKSGALDRPEVGISFNGVAHQNPYRFVIVAKGTAIQAGEVDLKWIGGVQSESSNGYHPEVFQGDDRHDYQANEPVLLVMSSDPFSVSEQNNSMYYAVRAELMKVSNFQFQSVELQIWQGKGSTYNWTAYLSFLVVLMVAIFSIYRVVSR